MQWYSVDKYSPIKDVVYLVSFKNHFGVSKVLLATCTSFGWEEYLTGNEIEEEIVITHFAQIEPVEK